MDTVKKLKIGIVDADLIGREKHRFPNLACEKISGYHKGSDDELANIFQKLNQEGVKLSKYDVFAATWVNQLVQVKDDPSFIDYIIKNTI